MISPSTTFHYTGGRRPEAGRPTIVFIHGAGHDHSVWTLQARHFAAHGWNVIAPDLPGHGRSAGPQRDSIEALAEWMLDFTAGLGCDRMALVGHSMGSLVALEAAAQAPGRISHLMLIGSVAPMPVATPLLDATLNDRGRAHVMINQWSYAPRAQLGASSIPGLNLTAVNERLMQRQAPDVLHRDMAACNTYSGGFDAAARVVCPTLLVGAALDRMTPPRAVAPLAAAFRDPARLRQVIIPGAGHAMVAEAPGAVLDALWNFVHAFPFAGQEP